MDGTIDGVIRLSASHGFRKILDRLISLYCCLRFAIFRIAFSRNPASWFIRFVSLFRSDLLC